MVFSILNSSPYQPARPYPRARLFTGIGRITLKPFFLLACCGQPGINESKIQKPFG